MHLIVRAILQIWPYVNNEPKAHLVARAGRILGPTWSTRLQTKGMLEEPLALSHRPSGSGVGPTLRQRAAVQKNGSGARGRVTVSLWISRSFRAERAEETRRLLRVLSPPPPPASERHNFIIVAVNTVIIKRRRRGAGRAYYTSNESTADAHRVNIEF